MSETTAKTNSKSLVSNDQSKCPYCQRRFRTPDELTLHIVTKHTQRGKGVPATTAGKR